MKKIFFFLVFALTYINGFSQKNDYIWEIGYNDHYDPAVTGTRLDFNFTPVKVTNHNRNLSFGYFTDSSICDSFGNLQFYTNGFNIQNGADQVIENGDHMLNCNYDDGCLEAQTALTLPIPGKKNKHAFFSEETFTWEQRYSVGKKPLYYSEIDMSANNGAGVVTVKNQVLIDDTLTSHLTATRHANGRDWWILAPKNFSNLYYKFLLTPSGVKSAGSQAIGSAGDIWGESVFSPDGSVYVKMDGNHYPDNYLNIFRFDRCSGLLSDSTYIHFSNISSAYYVFGIAISPNSRFLYVSKFDTLFQYDLQNRNIASSKVVVAIYDGYVTKHNFPSLFGKPRLAPDGKIYIATIPPTYTLHIVTEPDQAGEACEVFQHALLLPTYNRNMPNFPNFRLGKLKGSPCDTLTPTADVSERMDIKLYPNPTSGPLTLELSAPLQQPGRFFIYDRLGRLVYSAALSAGMDVFHPEAAGPAAGMYICALWEGKERVWSGKLAVLGE